MRARRLILLFGLLTGGAAPAATVLVTNAAAWPARPRPDGRLELTASFVAPGPWRELVPSWNVQPADGASLRVEARPRHTNAAPNADAHWYVLGDWSLGLNAVRRASLPGQQDAAAEVKTDTLVLAAPAPAVDLRLTLGGPLAAEPARLRLLALTFAGDAPPAPRAAPLRAVWGRTLDVPQRSQVSYPDGRAWCSPTSVSMLLAWWARELGRPELDHDVPAVAAGVHDPEWPGTGNWPFNTAFAGAQPGQRAFVARLRDLRTLEELLAAGLPPALSVGYGLLKGKNPEPDDGHLVVLAGFTADGDPVINDPWAKLAEGQPVRRVYRRAHLEAAWASSQRTAYLVLPETRLAEVAAIIGAAVK
jgi:hypothetical protein